ncbi:flagellar basal-body rod protein FlgB [Frankineae bacterium MT45]|nr:flagellar basal-body rod protein FlgB [Frankineae bacterium MT45]
MLDDVTSVTLQAAMTGLAQRQRVTANNIANVETPGYIAQRVSFEDSLASAFSAGDPASTAVQQTASTDNSGVNGNNVNLSSEIVIDEETTMQNQLVAGALTAKYGLISTVLQG